MMSVIGTVRNSVFIIALCACVSYVTLLVNSGYHGSAQPMQRFQTTHSCDPKQDTLIFHNETPVTSNEETLCSRCNNLRTYNDMATELQKPSKPSGQEKRVTFNCTNSKNRCCNKGNWIQEKGKDDYSKYNASNTDHDCKLFVSRFLKNSHSKSWVFVGDSTMRKTYDQLVNLSNCRLIKRCETPCSFETYLNMKENFANRSYDKTKLCDNSGDGCKSQMHDCNHAHIGKIEFIRTLYSGPLTKFAFDSYLGHIMDKFIQLYLHLQKKTKPICVMNVGMHGMAQSKRSDETYVENIRIQMSLLKDVCEKIIWLSLNSVLGDPKRSQKNDRILKWNGMVDRALQSQFPEVGYIDMYPMSTLKSMHADNIHMNVVYYQEVAKFFILD